MTNEGNTEAKVAVAPPKSAGIDTGYVVLAREKGDGDGPAWKVVSANLTARSAEHAVRIYAEKSPSVAILRILVAVPVRSWRPVTVSAKVTTTLVIEGADS